ncbi:MAG: radical SAM protein [Candidatus Lokiarchaeota archaeon]|nr:radical SAM protein [Candidatus Lokiarchaeota archaeon]
MVDIAEMWQNKKTLEEVNNVSYFSEGEIVSTGVRSRDSLSEVVPELDLLDRTLKYRGVMQFETSRGCTHACSFCPRAHKGTWDSGEAEILVKIMPHVARVFEEHPNTAKKIFLLDEEFIGKDEDNLTEQRIKDICNALTEYGFTFESSARIDQVYNPDKDAGWHVKRMELWDFLKANGMDRMLFGIESGVDSVLNRFNKRTTGKQNELGIRMLSSLGVPYRFTYITFDPLMNMSELIDTYKFQGRRDLILRDTDVRGSELFNKIQDNDYATHNSLGEPLYRQISYMLVSMECLLGSNYLRMAEQQDLDGDVCLSMGRKNVDYLDARIGLMSGCSQMWIDRNFALDYFLKSVEKVSSPLVRDEVRELRKSLKDAAYSLLGIMLSIINADISLINNLELSSSIFELVEKAMKEWKKCSNEIEQKELFFRVMDSLFSELVVSFKVELEKIRVMLPKVDSSNLDIEINRWENTKEWNLINN